MKWWQYLVSMLVGLSIYTTGVMVTHYFDHPVKAAADPSYFPDGAKDARSLGHGWYRFTFEGHDFLSHWTADGFQMLRMCHGVH